MKWRLILIVGLACAVVAGLIVWLQHARLVGSWLQVHTGTVIHSKLEEIHQQVTVTQAAAGGAERPVRMTCVLVREGGQWTAVQSHASIGSQTRTSSG